MRLQSGQCLRQLLSGLIGRMKLKAQAAHMPCLMESYPVTRMTCISAVKRSFHQSRLLSSATIYALSSGHGKCGVAVIRLSGPKSRQAIQMMTKKKQLPTPRMAVLRRLYDPETQEPIDKGLLLWFPGPDSFTGEDCCEFHVHGGRAVVEAMFKSLACIKGLRHAEAGEFTKRAFEHGKLDLTEVEGLADLIHAETEAQRRQALRQMEGSLSNLYAQWRNKLLKCCANVEAFIDFSEEENIEAGVMEQVEREVRQLVTEIEHHLNDNRRGERLRNGVHIAIIGQPNVGKSSLLNLLCQRPAAIVSPIPGTTRDVVETALNFGGYPVLISDTAGLRETQDQVESEGVKRAINRARNADIKVIVVDLTKVDSMLVSALGSGMEIISPQTSITEFFITHLSKLGLFCNDHRHISSLGNAETLRTETDSSDYLFSVKDCIVLFNKVDLFLDKKEVDMKIYGESSGLSWCCISCLTQEGVDHFLDILQVKVKEMCYNPDMGSPSLTQARHREHLSQCLEALHHYLHLQHSDVVLGASSLHLALRNIGKITGKITTDEILDVVFRDFCIGK